MNISLIGNGVMAQSLAKGLAKNHTIEIIGRDIEKLRKIKENIPNISIKVLDELEDISGKNIIFCVKPYSLQSVSLRLTGKANILISILAGVKLETLKKHISSKYYIRVMPNIAASVQESMTTLTGDKEAKMESLDIFSNIGQTMWLETEKQLDIATAIAGSGPAFLALIAEALADGAVKAGLERHLSVELVQGLFNSGTALLKTLPASTIKDSVMSPGGTTAAGYGKLEEHGVRTALIDAVETTYNKAVELGKK